MNSEERLSNMDDRVAEITREIYNIEDHLCDPITETDNGEFDNVEWLEQEVNSLLDEKEELMGIIQIDGQIDY